MPTSNTLHFFLGAHTPQGYVSRADQIDGALISPKVILKGGPGTGKSTLIRRMIETVPFDTAEILHCAANPASLDGVILSRGEKSVAIIDGTGPHMVEPRYPGVVESIVNLGDCLDESLLRPKRDQVIDLFDQEEVLSGRVDRFLTAAGSLLGDTTRLAQGALDVEKLDRFADRLCRKELSQGQGKSERIRFLTTLTANGITVAGDTVESVCDKLFLVEDEYGAVSRLLLSGIRRRALDKELGVISCLCPMAPFDKLEHLLIPELSLGFVTVNRRHPFEQMDGRKINGRRFINMEKLGLRRQRLSFNRKAISELLDESAHLLRESVNLHEELEAIFRPAMDYQIADRLAASVAEKIDLLLS